MRRRQLWETPVISSAVSFADRFAVRLKEFQRLMASLDPDLDRDEVDSTFFVSDRFCVGYFADKRMWLSGCNRGARFNDAGGL